MLALLVSACRALVSCVASAMFVPALLSRWLTAAPLLPSTLSRVESKPLLRLDSNGQFHISIFSDLHYGEEEDGWGIAQDAKSNAVIKDILAHEKPPFVVINGDLITGENTFKENSTKYFDVIVSQLVENDIPWASTYGNHDSKFNLSREALFEEESKYKLSYTQHGPKETGGVTNYYLPVYPPSTSTSETPVAILWFFDSQGGSPYQNGNNIDTLPDYVEASVVTWFQSSQTQIEQKWGSGIPSLAFVHIPPTSFLDFQQETLTDADASEEHFPGLNADLPLEAQGDGTQDGPFMKALLATKGLHSVYSGHDHGDAWCGKWPESAAGGATDPPFICFCKHTGYGGYGSWNRGSRNLMLTFEGGAMDVETWVRMEDGGVVQRVGLNLTYGVDVYPTADGE